jgi:hypothetical protein
MVEVSSPDGLGEILNLYGPDQQNGGSNIEKHQRTIENPSILPILVPKQQPIEGGTQC